jgi:hypothetical protein
MTNQENDQALITIEDLPVAENSQNDVKGGPVFMNIEGVNGSVQTQQPMPQTREHILLARQVG